MTASKWQRWDCLGFDLETTGVNVWEDRIVTAALVAIWSNGTRRHLTSYVVDPGIDIPQGAADVHGYTRERAIAEATHTDTGQALFEMSGRLALALGKGIPVVGANISYDLSLLEAENRRHGQPTLVERLGHPGKVQPVVDVMVLDRYADKYRRGSRKLTDLCTHYAVTLDDAHNSGADALAACLLWPKIMTKHAGKFPGHTLASLHQGQIGWRREQLASLQAFHEKAGKASGDYCGEWPIHRTCAPALVGGA